MQSIKVIIFDIDGTLLNTDELYFKLLKHELNKLDVSFNEKQYALYGLDDSVFHLGLDEKIAQKVRGNVLRNYYNDQILKKLKFKKGARSVIHSLSKQYKLAIGSGEKIEQIERYLKYQNLNQYFQFIGHGGLVPDRKSNPDYFWQIAKFFKVRPEECLMVGDSVFDAGGIKAGCSVVIIPSKFTKHCTFDKQCFVLNNIQALHLFLKK
ncbi:MAG: phosphatase/phosphohexomutase [uncultured bacterium]|nr:MAG: phosphatase/phosphohexomutase [uncultured bacterium]